MKLLSLSILICVSVTVFSQEKLEKESRIDTTEVPEEALAFIDQHKSIAKFKWYKEESANNISFEAKAKISGQLFSVEFNEQGELEDVEVQIKFTSIDLGVQDAVTSYLQSRYKKHKLVKVQVQYTGAIQSLNPVIDNQVSNLTVRYEIVLFATNQEGSRQYEMTFSETGEHINTAVIVFKNFDNVEY